MNKKLIFLLTASICTLALCSTYAADGDLNVTGKLGVGTTNPSAKLHVNGAAQVNGSQIQLIGTGGNLSARMIDGGTGDPGYLQLYTDGTTPTTQIGAGATYFNAGNVGIGTTSPVSELHVKGNAELQGNMFFSDGYNADVDTGLLTYNGTYFYILGTSGRRLNLGSNYVPDRMVIDTNGNIGIGTTSPGAKLDMNSGGTTKMLLGANNSNPNYNAISLNGNNADNARIGMTGGGSGDGRLYIDAITNITFRPGATATHAMTILSDGKVGIGTTAPTSKLHVIGNFTATGSKNFEIDHPTKADRKLIHACLEGPEVAVYYRGEAKLRKGQAVITLPEYFEALTRKEGRTIQLTAQGKQPYLLSFTPIQNGIFTVYGSKNSGEFCWEVKAVRADVEPLVWEKAKQLAKEDGYTVMVDAPLKESVPDPESAEFIGKLKEKQEKEKEEKAKVKEGVPSYYVLPDEE